ncbi:hypothetical protein DEJ73_05540 [Chromohalobacter salexigens]|nr:hypothetical protein [Chromohalobacter salexigens]
MEQSLSHMIRIVICFHNNEPSTLSSLCCRLPPAACRLPPAACRLPPAVCRLPSAASRHTVTRLVRIVTRDHPYPICKQKGFSLVSSPRHDITRWQQ